jgi:hypothetical protein
MKITIAATQKIYETCEQIFNNNIPPAIVSMHTVQIYKRVLLANGVAGVHLRLSLSPPSGEKGNHIVTFPKIPTVSPEPVFVNVYGAQESIPRNRFSQPM